jgi:hypothetical protein
MRSMRWSPSSSSCIVFSVYIFWRAEHPARRRGLSRDESRVLESVPRLSMRSMRGATRHTATETKNFCELAQAEKFPGQEKLYVGKSGMGKTKKPKLWTNESFFVTGQTKKGEAHCFATGRTWTYDLAVNSRSLWPTELQQLVLLVLGRLQNCTYTKTKVGWQWGNKSNDWVAREYTGEGQSITMTIKR